MTTFPPFPGFDGLLMLSRREGVDIRPTLLRVLTDLYIQTPLHTLDEERQYVELTSRLIDEVDDATRAAVRARLSIYSRTPPAIASKLGLSSPGQPSHAMASGIPTNSAQEVHADSGHLRPPSQPMQGHDAAELNDLFLSANAEERRLILHNLERAPPKVAAHVNARDAERAVSTLEHTALEADVIGFTAELAHALVLPLRMAQRIVDDPGGEALACAVRALGMPDEVFQRVLLFLDPELGASVARVHALSRFYATLSERAALTMLAAWRGAASTTSRVPHRPVLHNDERQRIRSMPTQIRANPPAVHLPGSSRNVSGG